MPAPILQAVDLNAIPEGLKAGDLLIAHVLIADQLSYEGRTIPDGWVKLGEGAKFRLNNMFFSTLDLYAKIATASEPFPAFSSPNILIPIMRIARVTGAATLPTIFDVKEVKTGSTFSFPEVISERTDNLILNIAVVLNPSNSFPEYYPMSIPTGNYGVKEYNTEYYVFTGRTQSNPGPSGATPITFLPSAGENQPLRGWTVVIPSSVAPPPDISFTGAASGTTSVTIPAHKAGDLLVACAFRDAVGGNITLPAGWTSHEFVSEGQRGVIRLYSKIAQSSSETFSVTGATSCIVNVYRPKEGLALSVGATTSNAGRTSPLRYSPLTLQKTDGTSWVVAFGGHCSSNTTIESPPPNTILRHDRLGASDELVSFDTNKGITSWAGYNVTFTGTADSWLTANLELKVGPAVPSKKAVRRSYWV